MNNIALEAHTEWVYDDGGREAAGHRGSTDDCAARAIAIAAELSYQEACDLINEFAKRERPQGLKKRSSAFSGVWRPTMNRIMEHLGWEWVPTMGIGTGCTVHLCAEELPAGRVVARVSKHSCAVVDGVVHDLYDPSRDGTRCVYGYWRPVGA